MKLAVGVVPTGHATLQLKTHASILCNPVINAGALVIEMEMEAHAASRSING